MGLLDQQRPMSFSGKRTATPYQGITAMDAARFVAEATPIIGDAMAAKEVYDELQKPDPNYAMVAALGGAALVGLVPGLGDAMAAGIKKGARGLLDTAKRIEVDPNALGMSFGNIKLNPKADPTQTGWTFRDVEKPTLNKEENRRVSALTSRVEEVPINQIYATQPTVNPDFSTTSSSAGELPFVVRKNGKMFVQDGHHRLTKVAEEGVQNAKVRFIDLDGADTSTPLLDYDPNFNSEIKGILDTLYSPSLGNIRLKPNVDPEGYVKPTAAELRREANIQKFGYDPNEVSQTVDTSYRGGHQPRGPQSENPVRLDDITKSVTGESGGYPSEFYGPNGAKYYAPGPRFIGDEYGMANKESYGAIIKAKNSPDAEVTMYRAVPNEDNITSINEGDFVTLSPTYAKLHGAEGYGPRGDDVGKVISQKVKVKDLYFAGDDVNEFGYFPSSGLLSEIKPKKKEQTKLGLLSR